MTAIEASSVRVSTLADGTLRLVVDIEPRHANAAFALFGSPGVPMALAALKTAGHQSDQNSQTTEQKPLKNNDLAVAMPVATKQRMGPLCEWAVYRCKEPSFQRWALGQHALEEDKLRPGIDAEFWARSVILRMTGVESRKELDTNREATLWFKVRVMEPYAAWLKTQA